MDYSVIFIAGPQGCGKGTQGKRLAEKLGFLYWGMGSMLRKISMENTPLAEKLAAMNDGELLTDDVIIEVLNDRLPTALQSKGIIFDGIPRRLGQAEFLVRYLRANGKEKMATVLLELPREESIKRLLLRAQHESRTDDTLPKIEERLNSYVKEMGPTEEYLKQETDFFSIDGQSSVETVERNIHEALKIV